MIRVLQIISWWINRPDGSRAPDAWQFVAGDGASGQDVTGQTVVPGDPNAVVVELIVSQAQYDAIIAHPDYGEGAILHAEEVTDVL